MQWGGFQSSQYIFFKQMMQCWCLLMGINCWEPSAPSILFFVGAQSTNSELSFCMFISILFLTTSSWEAEVLSKVSGGLPFRASGPHIPQWFYGERQHGKYESCFKFLHFLLVFFIEHLLSTYYVPGTILGVFHAILPTGKATTGSLNHSWPFSMGWWQRKSERPKSKWPCISRPTLTLCSSP